MNNTNIGLDIIGGMSRIQHHQTAVNSYKIRLNDDVSDPENYRDELNTIEDMGENDTTTIVLNNGGGSLDTAIEFCSAIIGTEGHVHGHISGCAHSAASMIFLKCHSFSVSPYATMLIHNPSGGFVGKMNETFAQADHFRSWLKFFYTDVYQDFLSEEEIESILDGKDLWLNAEQIEERLIKMVETRNKAEADKQAEEFFDEEVFGDAPVETHVETSEEDDLSVGDLVLAVPTGEERTITQIDKGTDRYKLDNEECFYGYELELVERSSEPKFQIGDVVHILGSGKIHWVEDVDSEKGIYRLDSGLWYSRNELGLVERAK